MKGYDARPEECCGKCKYYCKHYARMSRGNYVALRFGHCTHPRLKNRRAEEHCQHFVPAQEDAPKM